MKKAILLFTKGLLKEEESKEIDLYKVFQSYKKLIESEYRIKMKTEKGEIRSLVSTSTEFYRFIENYIRVWQGIIYLDSIGFLIPEKDIEVLCLDYDQFEKFLNEYEKSLIETEQKIMKEVDSIKYELEQVLSLRNDYISI